MLPNLVTLSNLFCGCLGVVFVLTDKPTSAIICIGLSLLFDFLDGMIARLLDQQHPLGGDLDSLADVVSFGVLPGVMYYTILKGLTISEGMPWVVFLGFIFTLFGAYRLARFNVLHSDQNHFLGLPIPSAALFVTGLYWINQGIGCDSCTSVLVNPYVVLFSIFFLSYLMVSSLPHLSFKMRKLRWKGQEVQWIYLVLVILLVAILNEAAVSMAVVLYIFLSLVYFSIRSNRVS